VSNEKMHIPNLAVTFESRPFSMMRYPSLGDWFYEGKVLRVVVAEDDGSEPISRKEQKLILLHELVEVWLCEEEGITQKQVDDFDFANLDCPNEPGDLPDAPYRKQHRSAMLIEHMMAWFMGMTDYGRIE